ncbi:hypothetical protein GLOIN_2v1607977 [Rhizophagus clarus]|uniref:Uncharacterized protein n=1 Tax=Rhizophagus clarus TaxID=94130 RepID=A0A8H3QP65_9GLOM|nr:hypothetical protein GLOIN_2v1607977 [Rhizophagus clarus]
MTTETEAAIREASVQLDHFIEKISTFLSNIISFNIKTFTPPEKIIIVFKQDDYVPVSVVNKVTIQQRSLYTDYGFDILKYFHNDIGKYLEGKFEGRNYKVLKEIDDSDEQVDSALRIKCCCEIGSYKPGSPI